MVRTLAGAVAPSAAASLRSANTSAVSLACAGSLAALLIGGCEELGNVEGAPFRGGVPVESDRSGERLRLAAPDPERASFQGLGDLPGGETASYVSDVSASGDVIVGWSHGAQGEEAVRWTRRDGLQALGGPGSRAQAVSPDGRLIAGSIAAASREGGRAGVLWREDAPFELLGEATDPPLQLVAFSLVDGKVVLDDARVYGTCVEHGAEGTPLACRFDPPAAVTIYHRGHVFAANAAGTFVGTETAEDVTSLQSRATCNGDALPYPDAADCISPTTGCRAEARDLALGGARIVGTSLVPEPGLAVEAGPELLDTAFVYTRATGALSLPNLEYGLAATGAYAVSPDGRVVAGFGTDDRGQEAVVWINGIPASLEDLVVRAGGTIPDRWQLFEVRAMSADARTFVGNGSNPDGAPEAFRVVLPSAL